MNKHYPYRFKTKEEFTKNHNSIDERWRCDNGKSFCSFVSGMDYLFGKEYPFDIDLETYSYDSFLPNDHKLLTNNGYRWYISKFMLTENKLLTPDYKPKNKIKRLI